MSNSRNSIPQFCQQVYPSIRSDFTVWLQAVGSLESFNGLLGSRAEVSVRGLSAQEILTAPAVIAPVDEEQLG